ncbi:hypothetical protein WMY93_027198 [Mugilogobius chulae]|uniref:E3 ubiquitin-protein ligase TRIM21-like n=1 Tax=Mugilogobius chulae TaxID=88201 RepID=A0AAW0N166_9GOBI
MECVQQSQDKFKQSIVEKHKKNEEEAAQLIEQIQTEISELEQRGAEMEQLWSSGDHLHFVQTFTSVKPAPQLNDWTEETVRAPSYKGRAAEAVSELKNMLNTEIDQVFKTEFEKVQEFFSGGKEKFSSGKFYFEVQVKGKIAWEFGVAKESVSLHHVDTTSVTSASTNTGTVVDNTTAQSVNKTLPQNHRDNTVLAEMVSQLQNNIEVKETISSESKSAPPEEVDCDVCPEPRLRALKSCLVCLASYCQSHLQPHLTDPRLKKHQLIQPLTNLEERICSEHDRPLELFCREHSHFMCMKCKAEEHKDHQTVPLKEKAEEQQAALKNQIKERFLKIDEIRSSVELSQRNADAEIQEGLKVFNTLMECVQQTQLIEQIQTEISELEQRGAEMEQLWSSGDHLHFVQTFTSVKPAPQLNDWTEETVRTPSYKGRAAKAVSELKNMLNTEIDKVFKTEFEKVQEFAVEVSLDPNTAHETLLLSKDLRQVHYSKHKQIPRDNLERFSCWFCVLGKEKFSSGKFYFEVQVKGKTAWELGVVKELVDRKDENPQTVQRGFWLLSMDCDGYKTSEDPPVVFPVRSSPEKVGVFVDYDEGLVSFYDVDKQSLIYSFTDCGFTENILPLFNPCNNASGKNSAPLVLLPMNSLKVFNAVMECVQQSQDKFKQSIVEKHKKNEEEAAQLIEQIQTEISELEQRGAEMEQLWSSGDHLHFVQTFTSVKPAPQLNDWTEETVRAPSYKGRAAEAVSELKNMLNTEIDEVFKTEFEKVQEFSVEVSLDPNTANEYLVLSKDLKQVHYTKQRKNHPNNPERFSPFLCVLGKEKFSSGKFYFEVQVKGKTTWELGVVKESVVRKDEDTQTIQRGFWLLYMGSDEYKTSEDPPVVFPVRSSPEKVGVFVDYDEGLVSFYDVDKQSLIYFFTDCGFTENILPLLSPFNNSSGKNSAPLVLLPMNKGARPLRALKTKKKIIKSILEETGTMATVSCTFSEEQLLCSICLEIFTAPVTTSCGHNFCKICINRHWDGNLQYNCPVCKQDFSSRPRIQVNTVLAEMVFEFRHESHDYDSDFDSDEETVSSEPRSAAAGEVDCDLCPEPSLRALKSCLVCLASYCQSHLQPHLTNPRLKKHQLIQPLPNLEEHICLKHNQPLELFCREHSHFVCMKCKAEDHTNYETVPLKEEGEKQQAALKDEIKERFLKIDEIRSSVELSQRNADTEIIEGLKVFNALMECVQQSQDKFKQSIVEKHKEVEEEAAQLIEQIQTEISELEQRGAEMEQLWSSGDHLHFVQTFTSVKPAPQLNDWTEETVRAPSFKGRAAKAVSELKNMLNTEIDKVFKTEFEKVQEFSVEVSLDPNTANKYLVLSKDLKQVYNGDQAQTLRKNPERFSQWLIVLGEQKISSGKFYFEVQVKEKTAWVLGVVKESVDRKTKTLRLYREDSGYLRWTVVYQSKEVRTHQTKGAGDGSPSFAVLELEISPNLQMGREDTIRKGTRPPLDRRRPSRRWSPNVDFVEQRVVAEVTHGLSNPDASSGAHIEGGSDSIRQKNRPLQIRMCSTMSGAVRMTGWWSIHIQLSQPLSNLNVLILMNPLMPKLLSCATDLLPVMPIGPELPVLETESCLPEEEKSSAVPDVFLPVEEEFEPDDAVSEVLPEDSVLLDQAETSPDQAGSLLIPTKTRDDLNAPENTDPKIYSTVRRFSRRHQPLSRLSCATLGDPLINVAKYLHPL